MDQRFQSVILDYGEEKKAYYSKLLRHPAFYTIQEHLETKKKQLANWADITHAFLKSKKILNSSLSELSSESYPFFCFQEPGIIPKRLRREEIKQILEELSTQGNLFWETNELDSFQIQLFSSYELADHIYAWAKRNYKIGEIETVEFIARGPSTEFYDLPNDHIVRALEVLQENNKGDLFEEPKTVFTFKFA